MLTAYENAVLQLIQAPSPLQSPPPVQLVSTTILDTYINTARSRVALEGECVRELGSFTIPAGLSTQFLTAITIIGAGNNQALVVRQGAIGTTRIDIRSWEWFSAYYLNATATATPRLAQLGEGNDAILYCLSTGGPAKLDVVCSPKTLINDSTVEGIPYPWTDAVPFYAAWLALMQLQRQADAEMMMGRYKELMRAARDDVTPTILPDQRPGGSGAVLASAHQSLTPPTGQSQPRGG